MDAMDGLLEVVVGGLGYGAGVEHNQLRVAGVRGCFPAASRQRGLDGRAVRLRRTTPEAMYEELAHFFQLSQAGSRCPSAAG